MGTEIRERPAADRAPLPCSVSRLWSACARRVLRGQRAVAWVSVGRVDGFSDVAPDGHRLLRAVAEELEASGALAGWRGYSP